MNMRTTVLRPVCWLCLFLAFLFCFPLNSCSSRKDGQSSSPNVYFGLTDSAGARVIILEASSNNQPPKSLLALLPTGDAIPIEFLEKRDTALSGQAREIAPDFDSLAGTVYKVKGGPITGDTTVLLAATDFVAGRQRLSVTHKNLEPIPEALRARIEKAKNVRVQHSWQLADIGSIASVVLVQCYPRNDTALACLVLDYKGTLAFEDYPGLLTPDSSSVWRVDDEGKFNPSSFRIIAAVLSSDGMQIARTWSGPEGENAALLRAHGSVLEKVFEGYRYWVPR